MNKKIMNIASKQLAEKQRLEAAMTETSKAIANSIIEELAFYKEFDPIGHDRLIRSLAARLLKEENPSSEEVMKEAFVLKSEKTVEQNTNESKKEVNTENKNSQQSNSKKDTSLNNSGNVSNKTRRSKRKEENIELVKYKIRPKDKDFSELYSYTRDEHDYIRGYYKGIPFSVKGNGTALMIFDLRKQYKEPEIFKALKNASLIPNDAKKDIALKVTTKEGIVTKADNGSYIGFIVGKDGFITLFVYKEGTSSHVCSCSLESFMLQKDVFHYCKDKFVNETANQLIALYKEKGKGLLADLFDDQPKPKKNILLNNNSSSSGSSSSKSENAEDAFFAGISEEEINARTNNTNNTNNTAPELLEDESEDFKMAQDLFGKEDDWGDWMNF